jgi:hypothetical protein
MIRHPSLKNDNKQLKNKKHQSLIQIKSPSPARAFFE